MHALFSKPFKSLFLSGALLACALHAHAADPTKWPECTYAAADRYNIEPELIWAIIKTESNWNTRALNKANSNGTADYGPAQINSSWFPYFESKYNIPRARIINDPCTNIHVSGYILAKNFRAGGRIWNSVGAYNAGFGAKRVGIRKGYVAKVLKAYNEYKSYTARWAQKQAGVTPVVATR